VTSQVGVVGGGTMGVGIAHAFATSGMTVHLVDADEQSGQRAVRRVIEVLEQSVKRGKMQAASAAAAQTRLIVAASISALPKGLDLIVEAVPEIVALKRDILAQCERREPRLLASNTSGISLATISEDLNSRECFLGLHFFNPVWVMQLVEVVVLSETSASAIDHAVTLCKAIGKESIIVRDAPGFASTRLGITLGLEAMRMVEEGIASAADIDRAMELGYRHPMGPLKVSDLVGLDVRLDIAKNLSRSYEGFTPPAILVRMVEAGELGKKSGTGFYDWSSGSPLPRKERE
jgi:3-hydroxybutyryl-CoA dehydrogenase